MVETEVPDRGEGLPKGDDCARASDYRSTDDVPVVVDYPKKYVKFLSVSRGYENTSDEPYTYR